MRRILITTAALLWAASTAHADSIVQTFNVQFQNVNQTAENSRGFLQFNANLGTLTSVRADFSGNILFAPGTGGGSYLVNFNGFAGGNGGPALFFGNTMSQMFQTNVPVDPNSVLGSNGFANYFLAFIDLSVKNGTVLTGSTATGTLTYNYTPAATPEPSSLLLAATGALGVASTLRRRLARG